MTMTDKKSNTDHLHEEGVLNKDDLNEEQIKSIDSLNEEEVEHLKKINNKVNKGSSKPTGIML